jgi:hypothetical protein
MAFNLKLIKGTRPKAKRQTGRSLGLASIEESVETIGDCSPCKVGFLSDTTPLSEILAIRTLALM